MDIQKCKDVYTKLYSLVIKELELDQIPEPVLNFIIIENHYSFFPFGSISTVTTSPPSDWGAFYDNGGKISKYQELSNGGDPFFLLSAIEEDFEIEIPDELSQELTTFKDLFGLILNIKYNIDIEKYIEIETRKKILKSANFLERKCH